jgi:hypothetical protein
MKQHGELVETALWLFENFNMYIGNTNYDLTPHTRARHGDESAADRHNVHVSNNRFIRSHIHFMSPFAIELHISVHVLLRQAFGYGDILKLECKV